VLGLLGLVGLGFGVDPAELGDAGSGGIGPYVVSHLGLPIILVALYVLIILNARYSSIDGAFSALSSIVAVDVLKRAKPDIASKSLLRWTKASIIIAGVVGGVVVSSGIDYVVLVNTVFFLKAALIIPLGLAIFWSRMTSTAFVASLVLAIAVGYPVRETVGELQGIIALEAVSLVVAVGISLLSRQKFDFATLNPIRLSNLTTRDRAQTAIIRVTVSAPALRADGSGFSRSIRGRRSAPPHVPRRPDRRPAPGRRAAAARRSVAGLEAT
jgi:Na+/proline symporter